MRIPSGRTGNGVDFNMTPMIDVVFLLIIFFLVSSNMARQETQMEMELPDAASGKQDQEDENKRQLVVNVPSEGQILVGTRSVVLSRLSEMLRAERKRNERPLQVRIRAGRRVPSGAVEPVLAACARAGVWDVSFVVVREGNE